MLRQSKKCASHFLRDTANENKQFKQTKIWKSNLYLIRQLLLRALKWIGHCHLCKENTLTVPLRGCLISLVNYQGLQYLKIWKNSYISWMNVGTIELERIEPNLIKIYFSFFQLFYIVFAVPTCFAPSNKVELKLFQIPTPAGKRWEIILFLSILKQSFVKGKTFGWNLFNLEGGGSF